MVSWTVGAEVLEDSCQRRIRHGDLKEIVAEWDLLNISW
jgi:hypothetical protein